MNNIILCSTFHDPEGAFLEDIKKSAPTILENYQGWIVSVTPQTQEKVKKTLQEEGVRVVETEKRLVKDEIEANHLTALVHAEEIAKEKGISKILYMDGDRVLMAATYFKEAFRKMAQTVEENLREEGSYLNVRRSLEDYLTHHSPLVETELQFNRVYSEVFGISLDIGSTIHGFSREVVREIINRSPEMETVTFPHPKWLIIAKEMGVKIQSREIPLVGSFETPLQRKAEVEKEIKGKEIPKIIEKEGGATERSTLKPSDLAKYEILQQADMATLGKESTLSPQEWKRRFTLYRQYLAILEDELPRLGLSQLEQVAAKVSIEKSRAFMKGKEAIVTLPPETRAEWVKEGLEKARQRWEKETGKKWQSSLESKE